MGGRKDVDTIQVLSGQMWYSSDKTIGLQDVRDDIPNMEFKIMINKSQWLLQRYSNDPQLDLPTNMPYQCYWFMIHEIKGWKNGCWS